MKKQSLKIYYFTIFILCLFMPIHAFSSEIKELETNGSISFTGVYEPTGKPDPIPHKSIVRSPIIEITKPSGILPQTNEVSHSWLIWLGFLLWSVVFYLWKQQNHQNTK
ncbi:LPXTG cell wall anchor domain-containing protein [Enterococcus mundtii]|uniref:LPXTG cell wall anchor domain-containing protein n=1 Tax=Enterococcus mundtii TaxID=53346 RepID=UPI001FBA5164|nr:LPXTG cell wall anchor domain-containing protein [Enterococcus mundtii]GKS55955.1 hypothetical protein EMLAB_25700 [Enterococcus mundtii]